MWAIQTPCNGIMPVTGRVYGPLVFLTQSGQLGFFRATRW